MSNFIIVNAQQAGIIYVYKTTKEKLFKTNAANIYNANGSVYRVQQEECARLRESVPYVKLYRYNLKHLYPKLNGYRDNGHRNVWASGVSTYCTPSVTSYLSNAHAHTRS